MRDIRTQTPELGRIQRSASIGRPNRKVMRRSKVLPNTTKAVLWAPGHRVPEPLFVMPKTPLVLFVLCVVV